jgi:hypothetical protein
MKNRSKEKYPPPGMGLKFTTLVVIVTDCIGSCKLPYDHEGPAPPNKKKKYKFFFMK